MGEPVIRDRIVELLRVPASSILPHPKNWRMHPQSQLSALRGSLESIGVYDAGLVIKTDDDQLMFVDGHARQELMGDQLMPVLLLDLTPDEARLALVTHDPITGMAEADKEMLEELLRDVNTDDAALQTMLSQLAADQGIVDLSQIEFKEYDESIADDVKYCTCPNCGHKFPQ